MENAPFLTRLITILNNRRGRKVIYPCIEDLVERGLNLASFSSGDRVPSRQDVTQYLAAWCKHAGLSQEECREWLIDYCVVMLSSISKTSASGIRHSTKSNVKYIYQADIPFMCNRDSNPFRVQCRGDCPEYASLQASLPDKWNAGLKRDFVVERPATVSEIPPLLVKESYKDQFETALQLIRSEIEKGTKRKAIIKLLNERGLKTKTGRTWTNSILGTELANINECNDGESHSVESDKSTTTG